tara:strand:+ start:1675 stop:1794 length:120 start_codon:yes stop_codon:yes gene_type:complete
MLAEIAAAVAVLIITPGWAIALMAIAAYIWRRLRSKDSD